MLDATAIRRLKNTEFTNIALSQIIIQPTDGSSRDHITSSETAEATSFFRQVDMKGYTTPPVTFNENEVGLGVDHWIDICRKVESNFDKSDELINLLAGERISRQSVEAQLKLANQTILELSEKEDELNQLRESTINEIEGLMDQYLQEKNEKDKAIARQTELAQELRELRANIAQIRYRGKLLVRGFLDSK